MPHISREKIALVVFIALIAISLFALLGYLAIGHSWNVAASNIDDATGRMDGYTAIVFEGTVDPTLAKDDSESTPTDRRGVLDDGEESDDLSASGVSARSGVASESEPRLNDSIAGNVTAVPTKKKIPIDLVEVEESYIEKNATVFTLDTLNIGHYSEGTILRKGDHRFGVLSVDPKTTARSLARLVEYFKEHEVDFIVALTPDKKLVETSEGIDIVISTQDEGLFVMGETINGTFYVNAPSLGSAGVILISPSNVVSAKVIQPE